ncbi:hypothetical protein R3P38DRAFT_2881915 [Favolaschia claudopus]|uniref:Uncharacterized protein n=1 Tax=Favolaschia claudopus TaxID=2862362 RepID=A0AAW0D1Z3_9AGAR
MELPQELVNSIIDAVVDDVDLQRDPWIVDNTPGILDTLKACSLVSHAFVHPCQTYIFHGVTVSKDAQLPPFVLSTLLKESPHLALHVRALYLEYCLADDPDNIEPIRHILASLENLARLDMYPESKSQQVPWQSYPEAIRASFLSAFALPYLRHITLWYTHFADALELQSLLLQSTSLKTLVLRSVVLGSPEGSQSQTPLTEQPPPRAVLESLQLYFLDKGQVQDLLDSFTAIDITHLRSLYLHNTPMNVLLRMNAATLEEIKIRAYYPDLFLEETLDSGALPQAQKLQVLELKVPFLASLTKTLRILGDFGHLATLRTISVTVSQKTSQAEWKELDELIGNGVLLALKDVDVFTGSPFYPPLSEEQLREWMPMVAGRNVLRVHSNQDYEI